MKNKSYVYVYCDVRKEGKFVYGEYEFKYEPFYVGKGKGYRYRQHLTEAYHNHDWRNVHKCRKIRKIKIESGEDPIIIKFDNLTDDEAVNLEIKLIKLIGRMDNKTGILLNRTDGGDGRGKIVSEKTRKLLSKQRKGKKLSDVHKQKIKDNHVDTSFENNGNWVDIDIGKLKELYYQGMTLVDIGKYFGVNRDTISRRLKYINIDKRQHITKGKRNPNISKATKGIKKPNGFGKMVSERIKGKHLGENNPNHKYQYIFISPDGIEYKFKNLKLFCEKYDLEYEKVRHKFYYKSKFYNNWKIERILI